MSMEQRTTSLEKALQLAITGLRASDAAMRRYEAVVALRGEAIRQSADALERTSGEMRELASVAERREEAVEALLAFVPVARTEIVRLDSRINQIEGA